MYEHIWKALSKELSGERAKEYLARIWRHARWNSFDRMQLTASEIARIMREIGMEEVDVIEYPADGVTAYGGWVMPRAWDVEDATLEVAEPEVADPLLARYLDCPQGLMMYSAPTPAGGLTAEVAVVDDAAKASSWRGREVSGRLVLVDGVGIDIGLRAFEAGAAGIVSDAMKLAGTPQDKGAGHLDEAVQWHNYTIPPWQRNEGGFGFSISPAAGRRLRGLLAGHGNVKLRAVVKARLYDGTLPLVTGLLPGRTREEIAVTAHLCEPGANDNASGCALGLELARAVRALTEKGDLPRLERGVRLICSFEVRGLQAFVATWPHLRRLVAGINLDMVGNDQSEARSVCNLVGSFPASPAYTDVLALDLLRRLARERPLFRFRVRPGEVVDNVFADPAVGAPTCVLGSWPDAGYHTSLDVIDTISPGAMEGLGRVAATYCAFLATAGFDEASWLARLTASYAEEELDLVARTYVDKQPALSSAPLECAVLDRLKSIARLVRPRHFQPTRAELERNADWRVPSSGLFRNEELGRRVERLTEEVREGAARRARLARGLALPGHTRDEREGEAPAEPARPQAEEVHAGNTTAARAGRLAPLRTFRGFLCFETLDEDGLRDLGARTGLSVGWGAPGWLQAAAFLMDGRRSALDIRKRLGREGRSVSLEALCDTVEFLAEHGFVRLRPALGKEDFLAAFREVGLPRGEVAMVHASLSRFGYVDGGAHTVIDALVEAIGERGTLVMPTLTCTWAGRPPFDPAATPSRVGAITEEFRKRDGALRSAHPSHSLAALGPRAGEITREHGPDRPVFSEAGAFGRLYALDAWVLMLAPLKTNTIMHMGEERAGLPLPDFVGSVRGPSGEAREVAITRAPWHANFDEHYRTLFGKGLVRSAPLGEETIHLMRARDAVDVATGNMKRDPTLVTVDGCECELCLRVRADAGPGNPGPSPGPG